VAAVPLKQRMNYRHLATKIGVPRTTVYYFLKPRPKRISRTIAAALEDNHDETKILKKHSSALNPYLSEEVKQHRFLFCLAQVKEATVGARRATPRFEDQYDRVHIDEKWFNMTKDGEKYILTMDEELPVRRVRHKCYIEKVMFLCAQARPRWDVTTRTWWDGKIGMWPIGSFQRAQRTSVNQPAGARVWVNEGMGHKSLGQ
jgi:predicted nucleic acid-binding protein